MTARWAGRVEALAAAYPRLFGVSVWRCLLADGFVGGYSTVTRELRRIRGPRFSAADRVSVPICTEPGEEAQFDWCNLDAAARRWGWGGRLRCFGMILCWSRQRLWWFTDSEDRHCTFEGIVGFFEAVGGAPAVCRTNRMGALGSSQGSRFVLHPAAVNADRELAETNPVAVDSHRHMDVLVSVDTHDHLSGRGIGRDGVHGTPSCEGI